MCDLAETLMLARAETEDTLMLLSVIARGAGARALDSYQTPRQVWAAEVEDMAQPVLSADQRREARYAEVVAFAAAHGGET